MESSRGKTTIKGVGVGVGGDTTVNYSDLSQAEDLVQTGRDQCFQVTLFYLFIFDMESLKQHMQPRDVSI